MEINDQLLTQWEPKIQKMVSNIWISGLERDDLAQELRIAVIKSAKAKATITKNAINPTTFFSFHSLLSLNMLHMAFIFLIIIKQPLFYYTYRKIL